MSEPFGTDANALKMIIIDDDLDYCEVMKEIVELFGHTLEITNTFKDAKEKIKEAEENHDPYAIAIIDMNLGARGESRRGKEIIEYITLRHPYIGCILVSGIPDIDVLELRDRYKLDDYIAKHRFDIDRSHEAIRKARERAAARSNMPKKIARKPPNQ